MTVIGRVFVRSHKMDSNASRAAFFSSLPEAPLASAFVMALFTLFSHSEAR